MHKISEILSGLNKNQKEAVYSTAKQLLLLAGAGTGKTHTLIARILYSTEILKVSPSNILALTFTNAAGKEMESRYVIYSETPDDRPFFGTFHSFCYNVLLSDINVCKHLGYSSAPKIISEIEEKTFQTKAQMLTSVKLPKKAYSITYEPTAKEKFQYQLFHKTLDKLLIQANKITFDRLCYKISQLFIDKHPLVIKYFQKYTHVYVDEFQDTDPIQWKFVQAFLDRSSVLVCGDIRQALYAFRGADSSIIKAISKNSDWEIIKLEDNYRSSFQICEYANQFVRKYNDGVPTIELKAQFTGPDIEHTTQNSFLSNIKSILLNIKGTTAILCRTNAEVSALSKYLDDNDIQYQSKANRRFSSLCAAALNIEFQKEYLLSRLPEYEKSQFLRKMYLNPNYDPLLDLRALLPSIASAIDDIQDSDNFGDIQRLYDLHELSIEDLTWSSKNESDIYVGTIHSVKGLEFDNVFVCGVNSKSFKIESSEDMMNLYYVACTRAKTSLVIVSA